MRQRVSGAGLMMSLVLIAISAAYLLYTFHESAHAVTRAGDGDAALVMQRGDEEHCIEMPADAGHGRSVFIQGTALGPSWTQSEGVAQVRHSVVFPSTTRAPEQAPLFQGRVIVCVRHE